MSRILLAAFSACPSPSRDGNEVENLLKALGPRHAVDALLVRAGDQGFVDGLHQARVLRVPVAPAERGRAGGTGGPGAEPAEANDDRLLAFQRAAVRQLGSGEYDVVHLRGVAAGPRVIAAIPASVRLCYDRRAEEQALGLAHPGDAAALGRADLILVSSLRELRALGPAFADRTRVLPRGVDVDRFDWESAPELRPTTPSLLFVGHIDHPVPAAATTPTRPAGTAGPAVMGGTPGPSLEAARAGALVLLVEAFVALRRTRLREARLLLVGAIPPSVNALLDRVLAEAGLPEALRLGVLAGTDMPRAYAAADVCVVPAHPGRLPRAALLEALACRRPVVAPRCEATLALYPPEAAPLLFAPGDAEDLATSLEHALASDALAARAAAVGYATVRREHTAAAARRHLLDAYARIAPVTFPPPPFAESLAPPEDDTRTEPLAQRPRPPRSGGDPAA